MLKKNLIAIAIITLGLGITSAFGQGRPPVSKKDKPKRSDAQINLMRVENQEGYMNGEIAVLTREPLVNPQTSRSKSPTSTGDQPELQITNNSNAASTSLMKDMFDGGGLTSVKGRTETVNNNETITNSKTQNKLGNFEIQGISETNKILDVINSPRDAASGQATGIQSAREAGSGMATGIRKQKAKNLGDTATHEVGYRQRKRGKN